MPRTLHLQAGNPAHVQQAAGILRQGGLVAFATETVYGLGASALSPAAVSGIFRAKQRPSWDPLIVHLSSLDQLDSIAHPDAALNQRVQTLAQAFWPGPLTLLLPRTPAIPDAVTAGRPLVGVRIPAHPAAQALLRAAAIPIAAPSANRFGHTSPTTAQHVLHDLDGRIDAVLDAGPCPVGLESTVLDPSPTPMVIYRAGAITPEALQAATGIPAAFYQPPNAEIQPREALPSPGVGLRHYAPEAPLLLTAGSAAALQAALTQASPGTPTGVLLPTRWALEPSPNTRIQPWAAWDDPAALAANLFAGLRALEQAGVGLILCPLPDPGGLRDALRDRLQKAARPR